MRLYNSLGPNPRVVRMFLAEKGLAIPLVEVDLMGAENRQAPYTAKNPSGQLPALELDDGAVLSEITAICEYIEDTHPKPPLVGANPREKAEARMWARRVDLNILEPLANGFRYGEGISIFKDRIPVVPEAAEGLKRVARNRLEWLDGLMQGRDFLCGARFTLGDMMLYAFLDFGAGVGQPLDPALKNIDAWFKRVAARPSAAASLHPAAAATGFHG